jgi:DNA-3-methyladenine glycosylase
MGFSHEILSREFFVRDTLTVAKELLGCYIVRNYDGVSGRVEIIGRITETEAYVGEGDKACHAYRHPLSPRLQSMYLQGGALYVYLIYGIYYCLNFVTEPKGAAGAVLLRSVELVEGDGLETASQLRYGKSFPQLSKAEIKNFTNGPGKVCMALGINKTLDGLVLGDTSGVHVICGRNKPGSDLQIKTTPRIGLGENCEEAKDFLWRFYIE